MPFHVRDVLLVSCPAARNLRLSVLGLRHGAVAALDQQLDVSEELSAALGMGGDQAIGGRGAVVGERTADVL